MADQVEQIVIDLDVQAASADADKLNAKLTSIEDKAARMGSAASLGVQRAVLTTSQTSQRAIQTSLDSYAKSVAFRTGDTLRQASIEYQNLIRRVSADTTAVQRATEDYKKLLASIEATRVAERQRVIDATRYEAASPVERIQLRRQTAISQIGSGADPRQIAALNSEFDKLQQKAVQVSESIGARLAEFITSPVYAIRKTIGDTASEFGKFGLIAAGAFLVIGEAAHKAFELVRESGRRAEELVNLGERLGISAHEAALLSTQAKIAGVSIEALGGLVRKLSTNLVEGSNESRQTVAALQRVGIAVTDVGGKFRSPVAILADFSENLNKLPDQASKVDLLTKTFGRQAVEMLPLIKRYNELKTQALSAGIAPDSLLKKMAEVDDAIDVVDAKWELLKLRLASTIVTGLDSVGSTIDRVKASIYGLLGPSGLSFVKWAAEITLAAKAIQLLGGSVTGALASYLLQISTSFAGMALNAAKAFLVFGSGESVTARLLLILRGIAALNFSAAVNGLVALAGAVRTFAAAQAVNALSGLLGAVGNITFAVRNGLIAALSAGETVLLALGQAALVVGAAFAGFKIGQILREQVPFIKEFGDAIADLLLKIPGVEFIVNRLGGVRAVVTPLKDVNAQIRDTVSALTAQGVAVETQGSRSILQYINYLTKLKEAQSSAFPNTTANRLVDQFNSGAGRGLAGLEARLQNLRHEQDLIDAQVNKTKGPQSDTETARIQGLISRSNTVAQSIRDTQQAIKDLNEAPQKLLATQELAQRGVEKLAEANQELYIAQHFGDQPLLAKLYRDNANALAEYNKQLLANGGNKIDSERLENLQKFLATSRAANQIDFDKSSIIENQKAIDERTKLNSQLNTRLLKDGKEYDDLLFAGQIAAAKESYAYQEQLSASSRDRELRGVELLTVKTLAQKIAQEQQKADIETRYQQRSAALKLAGLNADSALELQRVKTDAENQLAIQLIAIQQRLDAERAAALQISDGGNRARVIAEAQERFDKEVSTTRIQNAQTTAEKITQINTKFANERQKTELAANDAILKAQQDAIIKSAELIRDANTSIFERFKQESNGILDQVLTHSKSVFGAIGDAIKSAFLTAFKDIVSTQTARLLTQLATGDKVGLVPGAVAGGTGPIAKLAGFFGLGAKPSFGSVQSKLEQANHLGDVQLISSPVGAAIPVVIANPGDIQQQLVKATNTSSQVNQSFSISGIGGGGASRAGSQSPIAATVAALTLIGLGSAAQAAPSASKPLIEQVTSTLGGSEGEGLSGAGGVDFSALAKSAFSPGSDLATGSPNSLIKLLGGGGNFGTGGGFGGGDFNSAIEGNLDLGPARTFNLQSLVGGNSVGTSSSGGIGGALQSLKFLFSGKGPGGVGSLAANGDTVAGTGGFLGRLGGLFGGGAGLAKGIAGLGATIGLGLFASGLKKQSAGNSIGGGALAGFGIGAQFGLGAAGGEIGAGIGLLVNGYQRGGAGGFVESIGGGALAGLGIAGPIGAAVGAAVGAIIGGLRWGGVITPKSERLHDAIKSLYKVDIKDGKYIQQLMQIINQKYGGNIDAGVRSAEVRQMVELYAQATGQNSRGIVDHAQASVFANQGGKLIEQATYFNGQAVLPGDTSSSIGIPNISPGGGFVYSPVVGGANAGVGNTSIQLDAAATTALLQGQAANYVNGNPRAIAAATSNGMAASSARRSISAGVLNPALTIS